MPEGEKAPTKTEHPQVPDKPVKYAKPVVKAEDNEADVDVEGTDSEGEKEQEDIHHFTRNEQVHVIVQAEVGKAKKMKATTIATLRVQMNQPPPPRGFKYKPGAYKLCTVERVVTYTHTRATSTTYQHTRPHFRGEGGFMFGKAEILDEHFEPFKDDGSITMDSLKQVRIQSPDNRTRTHILCTY